MEPILGFDGNKAISDITEAGDYSRLVISQTAEAMPLSRLLVYTPELSDSSIAEPIGSIHNIEFRLPPPQGFHGRLWRAFGIPNNLQADGISLFHGLNGELPLNIRKTGIPAVVTIHDVTHRIVPQDYSPLERKIRDYRIEKAIHNADRIIVPSEYIKKEIIKLYGADDGKTDVICQPADDSFRQIRSDDELTQLRQNLNLPKRFILQPGPVTRTGNLENTVRALSALNPQIELVITGKDHKGYRKRVNSIAAELGITNRIHYYPHIEKEMLPALYQAADAIVYPYLTAGNGVNLLQGLESCRPIVAASGSCLEEFGGPDVLYFDPYSTSDLVSALNAIIFGGREINDMARDAKSYAARFTTAGFTSKLLSTYSRLLK